MKQRLLIILTMIFTAVFANAQTEKYENLDSAVNTLSSYYNAVNGKDYRRAYGYWQNPADDFNKFVKGFENTEKVRLIVEPPASVEGAAGSQYVQIPAVLIAMQRGGEKEMLAGCYTMRKSNLRPQTEIRREAAWHIYRADMKTVQNDADIPALLAESCTELPDKKAGAMVPGVIGFDSEDLSDAVKAPETVKANEEFQIMVNTSGNGCFSKGETSVVMGSDMTVDVFVYDFTVATRPGTVCTLILKNFSHTAALKFEKTGEAVIRVWGRKQGGSSPFGEPVVIEKRIRVR